MNYPYIMMVEDNSHDIEMIKDALNDTRKMILTLEFRDGAEAVKYFLDPADKIESEPMQLPVFILLDLKLPKVNGLEVLKILKSDERTKSIPIVIFTSSDEDNDRLKSYQAGVNSYLVKPLDADLFYDYIKKMVNYWSVMNTNAPC